jgi:hypothetical protein
MPRNLTITTHWTAAEEGLDMCNGRVTCPGVHTLADRPDLVFVICSARVGSLEDGRAIGAVPPQIHPTGRVAVTRVTARVELEAFAGYMGPGEILGTVPVAEWDGVVPVGAG